MTPSIPSDRQLSDIQYQLSEMPHKYGDEVHILQDPLALSLLARLGSPLTTQPQINQLVEDLYRILLHNVIAAEFPRVNRHIETRMKAICEQGVWNGYVVDEATKVVVVALARAGLLPSQMTYHFLNHILQPQGVRQDHLSLARTVNDQGQVTGAGLHASKIGGSIQGSVLLIPDPMGATGATVGQVLNYYRQSNYGQPKKIIALHLIITPEYLKYIRQHYPEVIVYCLRLDRGLSASTVLDSVPGTFWDEEKGLTDHQYIVPGAGGLGEILNNSYV